MKSLLVALLTLACLTTASHAVDRSRNAGAVSPFTGDNTEFAKVSVSSTSAATLSAYSTSRGALTCINADTSNTVYLGSSTALSAAGSASFPLKAGANIQILNNAGLYGIADAGVSSVTVYCIKEY